VKFTPAATEVHCSSAGGIARIVAIGKLLHNRPQQSWRIGTDFQPSKLQ